MRRKKTTRNEYYKDYYQTQKPIFTHIRIRHIDKIKIKKLQLEFDLKAYHEAITKLIEFYEKNH